MATGANVLGMLIPTGGWVIVGDDFDSIRYDEGVAPITKKQFDDGFSAFDAWQQIQENAKTAAAASAVAKLEAIGLTADEIAALRG